MCVVEPDEVKRTRGGCAQGIAVRALSALTLHSTTVYTYPTGGFLVQAGKMSASSLVSFIGYCFSLNFAIQVN